MTTPSPGSSCRKGNAGIAAEPTMIAETTAGLLIAETTVGLLSTSSEKETLSPTCQCARRRVAGPTAISGSPLCKLSAGTRPEIEENPIPSCGASANTKTFRPPISASPTLPLVKVWMNGLPSTARRVISRAFASSSTCAITSAS